MATRLPTRAEILDLLGRTNAPLHAREIASRLRGLRGRLPRPPAPARQPEPRGRPDGATGAALPRSATATARRASPARDASARGCSPCTRAASASWPASTRARAATTSSSRPRRMGGAHARRQGARARPVAQRRAAPRARSSRSSSAGIKRVAGTLRRKGKSAWLEPDDTRVRGPIVLPRAIDAAGPEGNSGNDGDAVVVAHHALAGAPRREPRGRASSRCSGRPGELSVEVAKILVLERDRASRTPRRPSPRPRPSATRSRTSMKEGREDLRHIPLPTIDPEDARDHDDAVWVERTDARRLPRVDRHRRREHLRHARHAPSTTRRRRAAAASTCPTAPSRCSRARCRRTSARSCPDVDRLCLCAEVELDAGGHVMRQPPRARRHAIARRSSRTAGSRARSGSRARRSASPRPTRWSRGSASRYELSRAPARAAHEARRARLRAARGEGRPRREDARADRRRAARDRPGREARPTSSSRSSCSSANETVARWCQETRRPDDLPRARSRPTSRSSTASRRCARRSASSSTSRTRATRRSSATCSSRSPTTRWRRCSTRCSCGR